MREIDPLFAEYEQLRGFPRENEALHTLRKIASLVKPIMRKRNWRVHTLCEFLPDNPALLGLNINKTHRICVRLRYTPDPSQFLPFENIVDTLLHELSHIIHGNHDANFHALWDELRSEYFSLKIKGYSGEGFLGEGHKLGGGRIPLHESRRQAAAAADKRRTLQAGSGRRLGGAPVQPGIDMRRVIADAAERRNKITQGCASGRSDAGRMAEEARRLGFRTKAEMDDADQLAIAIALMDDKKEAEKEEMRNLGATQSSEGLVWSPERGLEMVGSPPNTELSTPPVTQRPASQGTPVRPSPSIPRLGRPVSRLVAEQPSTPPRNKSAPETIDLTGESPESLPSLGQWQCDICTLVNDGQHLCCDACGIERPSAFTPPGPKPSLPSQQYNPPQQPPTPAQKPLGWNCRRCGSFMESNWWTCSACGLMKDSS